MTIAYTCTKEIAYYHYFPNTKSYLNLYSLFPLLGQNTNFLLIYMK